MCKEPIKQDLNFLIHHLRGKDIMIDADLARLYGVPTKALNQAVKRNLARFPEDFMFQLSRSERDEVVTNCDHLRMLKFSPSFPFAFTENGVAMLSSVLNSERAILLNIQIIRAFIRLRKMVARHETLRHTIGNLEQRVSNNERDIQIAFRSIRGLLNPPDELLSKKDRKMGFAS
jgi:hypothetical protein